MRDGKRGDGLVTHFIGFDVISPLADASQPTAGPVFDFPLLVFGVEKVVAGELLA